jgi:hypothetical protein
MPSLACAVFLRPYQDGNRNLVVEYELVTNRGKTSAENLKVA